MCALQRGYERCQDGINIMNIHILQKRFGIRVKTAHTITIIKILHILLHAYLHTIRIRGGQDSWLSDIGLVATFADLDKRPR